jgi:hypothetical protein
LPVMAHLPQSILRPSWVTSSRNLFHLPSTISSAHLQGVACPAHAQHMVSILFHSISCLMVHAQTSSAHTSRLLSPHGSAQWSTQHNDAEAVHILQQHDAHACWLQLLAAPKPATCAAKRACG